MALQHLRSSTADKRPTPAAMSDGQLALNTNLASPGLFFKDSNGDSVKIGPVHVGTTAPNVTPGAGGQAGNSKGEQWLDTSSSRYVFKIWDGTAWRSEDGEFVNVSGDTMTGALVMDNQQQVRFRETTANGTNFIAIEAPASVTADRTLTLPNVTGTIVSTGDTGSVTSTMILDGTILNADINASAAIADTKLATISTAGKVSNSATTATNANTASAIVARDASGNFTAGTITANLTGTASNVTTNANLTGDVTSVGNATSIAAGVIVNADINASAAIALSKLATGALPTAITVASANIVNGTIVNADINASAAIVDTKLATIATAGKVADSALPATISSDITGNAATVTTNANLTGDVTSVGNATSIAAGVIVNADINASAAIAGTKISPDFGGQNITIADKIIHGGDTNTAIRFPAADTFTVETGGVERVEFGNTEVVFNDVGANVDFRIEGDTRPNLFKIDAGLDQVQVENLNGGPLAGFRNAIINGNFDIWQRGTSFTGTEYGADRWLNVRNGTTHTVTRQPFTLGQTDVPGEPTYYRRTVVSSVAGAGNYGFFQQPIEDVRTFAGQQVTVSFWAKANATKNIAVEFEHNFGTGGSPSASVDSIGSTKVSIGTSWQKVTVTVTLPSISGKTLGTDGNSRLAFNIWFDAGSTFNARTASLGQQSGTFEIAQVQIETGPVATPFERRPIGTELALCQRYYESSAGGVSFASATLFNGRVVTGLNYNARLRFSVAKRATPTVTLTNEFSSAFTATPTVGGTDIYGFQETRLSNATTDLGIFSSHWTASAEL